MHSRHLIIVTCLILQLASPARSQQTALPVFPAPVHGEFATAIGNVAVIPEKWDFRQFNSPLHGPVADSAGNPLFYNIPNPELPTSNLRVSKDDTLAWDINLQVPGNTDLDAGVRFYPIAGGKVVWGGTGKPCNEILIQHSDKINGKWYYSAYLHGQTSIAPGTAVTRNTHIGTISNVAASSNHLHLAIYELDIPAKKLVKSDAIFTKRGISIAPLTPINLRVRQQQALVLTAQDASRLLSWNLCGPNATSGNQCRFVSANPAVADCPASGNTITIRAVGRGTTKITIYFSGAKAEIPITVTN